MVTKSVEGDLLFSRLRWAERDEMRGVCNQDSMRTQVVANKHRNLEWLAPNRMSTLNRMTSGLSFDMRWR